MPTPNNPSDADVLVALGQVQVRAPSAGLAKIVQALKEDHPDWHPPVDSKRVRALRKTPPTTPPSTSAPSLALARAEPDVLDALFGVLQALCAGGDGAFARRVAQIDQTLKTAFVEQGHALHTLPPPAAFTAQNFQEVASMYPARSCKLAATLVLLLAAPDAHLSASLCWLSRALGGLPTLADVLQRPSADALSAYTRAQKRAKACGETTALGVNLVDVEMLARGGDAFESFAHAFVLLVAPAGARVVQAWGEHGYSLAQNIRSGHGRLRSLAEGEEYMREFARLSAMKGSWNKDINKLYAKLFDVDVLALMRGGGCMQRPMSPKFRAWVRVLEIPDVRLEDVARWTGIVSSIDSTFSIPS